MLETLPIRDKRLRRLIKLAAETCSVLKTDWFIEGTLNYRCAKGQAIKQVIRYFDDLAKDCDCFIFPLVSIGLTSNGRWHFHATLLTSRHLSYTEVHGRGKDWTWKCGFSWAKQYNPDLGGIPYSLDSSKHEYLPLTKPFTPKRWRKKNKKLPARFRAQVWNPVTQALKVDAVLRLRSGESGCFPSGCSGADDSADLPNVKIGNLNLLGRSASSSSHGSSLVAGSVFNPTNKGEQL